MVKTNANVDRKFYLKIRPKDIIILIYLLLLVKVELGISKRFPLDKYVMCKNNTE